MTDTPTYSPDATAALHALLLASMDSNISPDCQHTIRLLNAGADINAPDAQGLTPLLRCLSWRYTNMDRDHFRMQAHDTLSLLLSRGADLAVRTPEGKTPADLAAHWQDSDLSQQKLACEAYRRSEPELATQVSKICTTWAKPGQEATALTYRRFFSACASGHIEEVVYLLHLYPDAVDWIQNDWLTDGANALIATVKGTASNNRDKIAALLIQKGCSVNWQNKAGMTALHYSCKNKYDADLFIPMLITAHADAELTNKNDMTPRDIATGLKLDDVVRTLDTAVKTFADIQRVLQRMAIKPLRKKLVQRRNTDGNKFRLPKP